MRLIAPTLWSLELVDDNRGWVTDGVNAYLMGDVLVDSGYRQMASLVLRELAGHAVAAHAITHAHLDHQGSSHQVCETLEIPLFCPEAEADCMETGRLSELMPPGALTDREIEEQAGPAHPVARRLRDGDEIGGFTVIATPGHSPGHISFWREADRALIVGDAISNRDSVTGAVGLREPRDRYTIDVEANRQSIRRLAALEPQLTCFGHGPELRDPEQLRSFAARLSP